MAIRKDDRPKANYTAKEMAIECGGPRKEFFHFWVSGDWNVREGWGWTHEGPAEFAAKEWSLDAMDHEKMRAQRDRHPKTLTAIP